MIFCSARQEFIASFLNVPVKFIFLKVSAV